MNTALQLVHEVEAAGGTIAVAGDKLKLAAPAPLPENLMSELRLHKADVLKLLSDAWTVDDWKHFYGERAAVLEYDHELPKPEAEARAWEWCIVEWLNQNPAPSEQDRCAWCGKPEDVGTIVPFGVEATWLHHACWEPRHQERRKEAASAMAEMGIGGKPVKN